MDWSESPHDDPAYFVPERHAEALTRAATRALRAGQPALARMFLRRRVRMTIPPAPAERALAALAASLAGYGEEASEMLTSALAADAFDPTVGLIALRTARTPEEVRGAARRLLANPQTASETRAKALALLLSQGDKAIAELDLLDGWLSGWVAWTLAPPILILDGSNGEVRSRIDLIPEPWLPLEGTAIGFIAERLPGAAVRYRVEREQAVLCEGSLVERSRHRRSFPGASLRKASPETPGRRPIRVVMPVYGDFEATLEALRAAITETARHPSTRLVVVDDASPVPAITALLDALARRGLVELRRNATNLGFTGAVARGLEGLESEDVLLLNADVLLPNGAISRLADIAYSSPDIGSVTPFSNNGEWTSWPRLGQAAPSPSSEQATRLDAAASQLDLPPIDLPNGIGFALFVRHDAFAASDGLPQIYDRGYFEDLEFTLQIRRAGFRNVAAPNVFAVHHGSRSFGSTKERLVAKNLRQFRRRFPSLREESAGFRMADPLREARERIEAACPPDDYPLLLVAPAGSSLAAERLHRHRIAGEKVVMLEWRLVGSSLRAEFRRMDGNAPQSLGFDADTQAIELARWIRLLSPSFVELAGSPPPEALATAILSLDAAFVILAGDLLPTVPVDASPIDPLLKGFEAWRERLGTRWLQVVASDRATRVALQRHLSGGPDRERIDAVVPAAAVAERSPSARQAILGVVFGTRSPTSQGFAMILRDSLRRRMPEAGVLAIGETADDLALGRRRISLTGRLTPDEIAPVALEAGVRALVLAPADPSLAMFERVLVETGLPGAYADWSEGAVELAPDTFLFDRSRNERDIADAVVDWFAGRVPA